MARRKKNAARASIGLSFEGAEEFLKSLEKLAIEVQVNVAEKAIEAGMEPIRRAMIPNTPKSRNNRKGQSKKMRKQWENSKPLHTTIRAVVRKRRRFGVVSGAMGLVGPSYTDGGGHGNFFASQHKAQFWWGKPATKSRIVDRFVKRTADQSAGAAKTAMLARLKKEIDSAAVRIMA